MAYTLPQIQANLVGLRIDLARAREEGDLALELHTLEEIDRWLDRALERQGR